MKGYGMNIPYDWLTWVMTDDYRQVGVCNQSPKNISVIRIQWINHPNIGEPNVQNRQQIRDVPGLGIYESW